MRSLLTAGLLAGIALVLGGLPRTTKAYDAGTVLATVNGNADHARPRDRACATGCRSSTRACPTTC